MPERSRRWSGAYRLLAIACGLGAGALGSLLLLWVWGTSPGELLLGRRLAPPGASVLSIHDLDSTIGYTLRPSSSFRHREGQFDVAYQINDAGSRRVPGFAASRPRVLVLGDSWTFGHGVEDWQSYTARLQAKWPDVGARNLGVMGYGTPHALLTLERALEQEGEIALVLYGWTPIHLHRSYLRADHLATTASGRTPRLEIENGRLVSKGLADASVAIADGTPGLRHAEWRRSVEAMKRMAQLSKERGARFVVVLLPGPDSVQTYAPESERMSRQLRRARVEILDLQADPTLPKTDGLFFRNDGHPGVRWNELVADAIATRLDSPRAHR